jgi:putative methionine-R-sulfoxide reductase with GAF domain
MATEDGEQQRKHRVRMNVSQGGAGRAYRTGQLCYAPITEDWRTQLMTEFGFTDKDLSRFQSDRKSYLCVPIFGEHARVMAVLSFDSKHADTFNTDRIARIEFLAPYFSAAIDGE